MSCRSARLQLAGYLDGAISAHAHATVRAHLESCTACRNELEIYRQMSAYMARVERAAAPPDLAVKIRLRAARAEATPRLYRRAWTRAVLVFENILGPLAVPATGGILTAVMVFVFVVQSMLVGIPFGVIRDDLPTKLLEPARLESLAPFPIPAVTDGHGSEPLLLEATLNAQGQVVYYRILSGPDTPVVRRQVDQVLLFSRFRPELSFGRPTSGGRVMLSFSEIRVRG